MAEAGKLGMHCFSTPFDNTAVDFLEALDVPAHKIASFELVDTELLKKVAATGKPVIMSTGMASLEEIREAVQTLRESGCAQLALLKCTSAYPSLPEDMNLRTIPDMAEAFELPIGLSDHTLGVAVPIAAVALGACIVEKHLTIRRSDGGPDSAFSLEPEEFRTMVEAVRMAEKALGKVSYEISEKEQASRAFRRSLFVVKDVKAGEEFTRENIRSIRPGHGLPVKELASVLGRRAQRDIERGSPLAPAMIGA
jgi:N-acetylneuraminate synthase